MALTSICGTLTAGQDNSCLTVVQRKYYQQLVLINRSSIDPDSIVVTVPTEEAPECAYNVQFSLKDGETGYRFTANESGSSIKGFFDKSRDDNGNLQYNHQVQALIMNVLEESKCILSALDKGNFVAALQNGNTIEIFGLYNGLTTGDYTFDTQEGGGGTLITLSNLEDNQESFLPFVYKSDPAGSEIADFDANFSNIAPSV